MAGNLTAIARKVTRSFERTIWVPERPTFVPARAETPVGSPFAHELGWRWFHTLDNCLIRNRLIYREVAACLSVPQNSIGSKA